MSECTLSIFLLSSFTDYMSLKIIGITGGFLNIFPIILLHVPFSFIMALIISIFIRYSYKFIKSRKYQNNQNDHKDQHKSIYRC